MKTLHLYPQPLERIGSNVKRSCRLERQNSDRLIGSEVLWYEFPEIDGLPVDQDAESYLIAVIMQAMFEGRKLIVHGIVSRELLANLTEYRDAWCCWLPNVYHAVDFKVDEIADNLQRQAGAVCAFSGGVDATFSVWRHAKTKNGYRSQAIKICTMIHGFDIPLQDEKAFERAFNQATKTLKLLDIPLLPLRTNFRQVIKTNWEHVFAAALVAGLQSFKKLAGTGIVGSSRPYNALVFPWGSNAATDYLLSSQEFRVLHDGATHSRTQKVATINEWKEGCDNLRVCWQGVLKDRNCGNCEKCLRTMLNFRVNNLPIPDSFPEKAISNESIRQVQFNNAAVQTEWRQILVLAISNDVQDEWVKVLNSTLKRKSYLNKIEVYLNKTKVFLKSVLPKGSIQRKLAKKIASFPGRIRIFLANRIINH